MGREPKERHNQHEKSAPAMRLTGFFILFSVSFAWDCNFDAMIAILPICLKVGHFAPFFPHHSKPPSKFVTIF